MAMSNPLFAAAIVDRVPVDREGDSAVEGVRQQKKGRSTRVVGRAICRAVVVVVCYHHSPSRQSL